MKKITKILISSVLTVTTIFSLTACQKDDAEKTADASKEMTLYTWEGMFPKEVLQGFEEETGIRVNYANFDLDETMLAKLQSTNGGEYDLVIADDYIIETVINEGLAQELDKSKISTIDNINPLYTGFFYDKEDKYTVPYGAGIPLIVYNPELTGFDITSYEDLWDERLVDNVALIGNYRVINGITLNSMGESLNCEDLDKIKEAGEKLIKLAPNVRVIQDNNTQDFLISEEVAAAFLYTSQVNLALNANPNLKIAFPKEGAGFGVMAAFIPSNAPNSDAAHMFLDYINRPEVAVDCFEYLGYYCTNKAAEEYISDDLKDRLIVPESSERGEIMQNISTEANDLQLEIWNKFKEACM